MNLTKEQVKIINSSGDIKINAVAGSGKTTTIIEYARTRPENSRILYLAFNKSVKLDAVKKFAEKGLNNVTVETAHSLAYKHIVYNSRYKISKQGYKTNEIAEILELQGNGEKHTEYVIANHISKFISYFCNSDKSKVQDLNYLDTVTDPKAILFVKSAYNYIETKSRIFLGKMDKGEIEIIHDFYLKKFQLSNPQLHYDYILFDEGQDASPAMLNVFLNQRATKVIVGDTHQQIYGWRYAVNSLEKAAYKTFNLSTSFRFSQDIADLAMDILSNKDEFAPQKLIKIKGKGAAVASGTKAILARTNLGLLLKAIEYVTEKKNVKQIYFEGNINSYTYADDGTSLYDVLNLFNGQHSMIRDTLIQGMKNLEELEDYIEKTEDVQLGMMVEIVREYGNKIPNIIKLIKEKHISDGERDSASMIFSTVHRCKGMEYDSVQLVNDFITADKLEKLKNKKEDINLKKITEEINLLYVAVTRTKNTIHIPETLVAPDFPSSNKIHLLKVVTAEDQKVIKDFRRLKPDSEVKKSTSIDEIRVKHKGAYNPWTEELDDELTTMFCSGIHEKDIAIHFGRTQGAIKARIRKLELEELYN